MTDLTDLTIPLTALEFQGDDTAIATADHWDTTQVGVLLQQVATRHAASVLDSGELATVSVSFDVSAEAATGSEVQFQSRIDRKTRTLVFASGLARQSNKVLLKTTVVFRIV